MTEVLAVLDDVLDRDGAAVRFMCAPWDLPISRTLRVARLGPAALADLRHAHAILARELELPDYYGENWDALADVLTDEDVFGEALAFVIVIDDGARALAEASRQVDRLAEVVQGADRGWREVPSGRIVRLVVVTEDGPAETGPLG